MEQIALELAAIGLDLVKIKRLLDPLSKEQIQEVLRHQSEQVSSAMLSYEECLIPFIASF
jgi:phosphopantetheinyl transferase (holo-ACP synthase)